MRISIFFGTTALLFIATCLVVASFQVRSLLPSEQTLQLQLVENNNDQLQSRDKEQFYGSSEETQSSSTTTTKNLGQLGNNNHNLITRRRIYSQVASSLLFSTIITPTPPSLAIGIKESSRYFNINNEIVSSLVFERFLGKGTFKDVYLVSDGGFTKDYSLQSEAKQVGQPSIPSLRFTLSSQRLRGKSDVNDAFLGVLMVEQIQKLITQEQDKDLFEKIIDWWVQPNGLPDFHAGSKVFPKPEVLAERVHKKPNKFLGSKWLIALKPVYDVDLKALTKMSPHLFPVGIGNCQPPLVSGMRLSEEFAINLVDNLCHAGEVMHSAGIVHRDIKPKNIMLHENGRPVLIDFGFAEIGQKVIDSTGQRICIVEPGKVKGEVGYVLTKDVAAYRGCQEGDCYAMGKTIFEVLFGEVASGADPNRNNMSGREKITQDASNLYAIQFRKNLFSKEAGSSSRFFMSHNTRDMIISVVRGLCQENEPMSFAQAKKFMIKRKGAEYFNS